MNRHLLLPSVVALAAALASPAAHAQYAPAPAVAPLPDVDALAAQMRVIAAQPTDVDALAQAGELSARLGDLSGAASLFARADKVDPRNGRVKAGTAEVLLRSERPGEALRYFDQAEGYGYPAVRFAAERGLAYDLVGQQGRAQRDYREVLAAGDAAEVRRRYALSLGIAGQGEAALQELDPLIRRNDRGAWRSRAFILAMQGDVAGATSIATTMMAPGQAQGLAPFFARLASLGPVDRAFAVHFGELRPTSQRLADARLAPALSPLAPEIVQVARAAPVVVLARVADHRWRRKGEVQLAAAIPVPPPLVRPPAYGTVSPTRPVTVSGSVASAVVQRSVTTSGSPAAVTPVPRAAGAEVAYYVPGSLLPRYTPRPAPSPAAVAGPSAGTRVATRVVAPVPAALTGPAAGALTARSPVSLPVLPARPPVASPAAATASAPAPVGILPASVADLPVPVTIPTSPKATVPTAELATVATGVHLPAAPVSTGLPTNVSSAATAVSTTTVPTAALPSAPASATPAPLAPTTLSAVAVPAASGAGQTPAPMVPAPAAPAAAPVGTSDAVLARIAEALAVPGRELAAAGAAAPIAQLDATTVAVAAAPPAKPAVVSFAGSDAPLVVNGELTEAGRAATTRRRHGVEALPASATPAAAGTVAEPVRTDHRHDDGSATDRLASRSARHDLVAADTAEPTPIRSRRQRAADKAVADDTPTEAPTPVDRKAAARQAAADRKALAEKKVAAEKKTEADKEAAEERKAKKAEPERYWVQVAGGANEGDLPKAWSAMKAKAPALAGHKGWSTPLRATNRVVTGPFKTDEEARAFVNTLKKQGVSAFQFTSEAGQKITRLDAK